jgi:hypothetical protein
MQTVLRVASLPKPHRLILRAATHSNLRRSPYFVHAATLSRFDLAFTSHAHLQSRSRVSHASVARGSVVASSRYTAVYATEQLRFGRIDLCRMSTRRTVTSTTSTRIVERSQVTAADGLHQHRRRAVGLVSDSRFVAMVFSTHRLPEGR